MIEHRSIFTTAALCCAVVVASGCKRDGDWDRPFIAGDAIGLSGAVAVVDLERSEVMMLTSPRKNELAVDRFEVGSNIVRAVPSPDRQRLFVLSRGVVPRLEPRDEEPSLSVLTGGTEPALVRSYTLADPLQELVLDPAGEWAVAYDAEGAVVNVNELMLVHLAKPDEEPIPITIRSTGGRPQRFTFTAPLTLPDGSRRRLLVIETSQDVSILDLEDVSSNSRGITVPLPRTQGSALARPAQVVFHDDGSGDGAISSYLALRFENDSNVLTLELAPPQAGKSAAFSLVSNLLDAGAPPSTIDFVRTDRGLRLAALVPARREAVLFDPTTSKSELVQFEDPYSGLARVTNAVAESAVDGDVALLYSSTTPSIAFWRLGNASSTPYASFDTYTVDNRVSGVVDVPGETFAHLKLLTGASGDEFFVLDLKSRLSHPMQALAGFTLRLSPDGERAWAFAPSRLEFAQLNFADKHPETLDVERPIHDVFDIERAAEPGRTLVALHRAEQSGFPRGASDERGRAGDLAVTLFDAEAPDSADTRFVSGLMLKGWTP